MVSPRAKTDPLGGAATGVTGPFSTSSAMIANATAAPSALVASAMIGESGSERVGGVLPRPVSAISNGFFAPATLLAICNVAFLGPLPPGVKVTVKVALPLPTGILVL